MAGPIHRQFVSWIVDHLFWDPSAARQGFWGMVWALRKLLAAIAGSAVLTWAEWVKHHPPAIVIVALLHLVFVLAAIALVVRIGQWFRVSL